MRWVPTNEHGLSCLQGKRYRHLRGDSLACGVSTPPREGVAEHGDSGAERGEKREKCVPERWAGRELMDLESWYTEGEEGVQIE